MNRTLTFTVTMLFLVSIFAEILYFAISFYLDKTQAAEPDLTELQLETTSLRTDVTGRLE